MDTSRITKALREGREPKVVVFGDFCLDKYLYIDALRDEPSVETALTAYQVTHKKLYPGAAGTISANLRALGAKVECIGIVGDDGEGYELMRCLEAIGAGTSEMIKSEERCTLTYTKPMRRENGREFELNRLDFKNFTLTPIDIQAELVKRLKRNLSGTDAVLVCDQFFEEDFSAVTSYVRDELAQLAEENTDIIFYADSRAFIDRFRNMMIKCNDKEISAIFNLAPEKVSENELLQLAKRQSDITSKPVFVTMGEKGSLVYDSAAHLIPAFHVSGEIDVVGAGDANNAGIIYALSKGLSCAEAALVGNAASSIVIRRIGVTGTATLEEVTEVLESVNNQL